ncbi:MAG: hypothetical protein QOF14_319 [Hyphomicrobiales bacterium]|jgi:hypothetical protein|nr:hypothetical protein [Hyphomicrobiales bacterium]
MWSDLFSLKVLPSAKRWILRTLLILLFGPFAIVWLVGFFGGEGAVLDLPDALNIWLIASLVLCLNLVTLGGVFDFFARAKHWSGSERILETVGKAIWIAAVIWIDWYLIADVADKLS